MVFRKTIKIGFHLIPIIIFDQNTSSNLGKLRGKKAKWIYYQEFWIDG